MARKTKEEAEVTRRSIIQAARTVFFARGVSRSSLERIAEAAGVSRGAIYWHFKDKAELFYAMREGVFAPMVERTDAIFFGDGYENPLDAIESAINEFFRVIEECEGVRAVFEIMLSRCEYVDEFAVVQIELGQPVQVFLEKMECLYLKAREMGKLRSGIDPLVAARDTWAFTHGLLDLMLGCRKGTGLEQQIPAMIAGHIDMRRAEEALVAVD
ncbi:MAG: TetR family transcriptional regulator [Betaproteobacteria bacterium HGW-Betaproteobacteria-12]|nr:MAG: TetR family transcriptional regulator [Betaproteobacteria bacterium HGW-Betaproteobacteria-12]